MLASMLEHRVALLDTARLCLCAPCDCPEARRSGTTALKQVYTSLKHQQANRSGATDNWMSAGIAFYSVLIEERRLTAQYVLRCSSSPCPLTLRP